MMNECRRERTTLTEIVRGKENHGRKTVCLVHDVAKVKKGEGRKVLDHPEQ